MVGMPLYFSSLAAGYNKSTRAMSRPVESSLLDTLQAQHTDSFGWAMACCAWQRSQAEDVLQEAYLRALDGRAKFSGKSSARTWFFGVIKRVAAEQRRSTTRRSILNLRLARSGDDEREAQDMQDASVYRNETARQLQQALMQLSERQREVLHLVFYAEMTLEEAALTLQVSPGSVRTHYHRGKERLSQMIQLEELSGSEL